MIANALALVGATCGQPFREPSVCCALTLVLIRVCSPARQGARAVGFRMLLYCRTIALLTAPESILTIVSAAGEWVPTGEDLLRFLGTE